MGAVSPTAVSYVCWLRELGTEEYTVLLVAGKMVGEIIEGKDREFEVGISEYDASDRLLGSSMVSVCVDVGCCCVCGVCAVLAWGA